MFKVKTWICTVGLLFVQTFLVCVLWNVFEPKPIYIQMLETIFPGFMWLSARSVLLGLLESFFYGAYVGGSFVLIHNFFYRRHHPGEKVSNGFKKAA